MKRSLFVAVLSAGFAAGCLATSLSQSLVVPPARAANVQRWEYTCHYDISTFNQFGQQGWELAAGGGAAGLFCFKRPL